MGTISGFNVYVGRWFKSDLGLVINNKGIKSERTRGYGLRVG